MPTRPLQHPDLRAPLLMAMQNLAAGKEELPSGTLQKAGCCILKLRYLQTGLFPPIRYVLCLSMVMQYFRATVLMSHFTMDK